VNWKIKGAEVEAAQLTTQLNLLGIIADLPKVIKNLKDQFEANEAKMIKMQSGNIDPLYKGE